MIYRRILWLPDALRAAGLTVVEERGWRSRGLGDFRPFDPKAVVWHHDASAKGDTPGVPAAMIGRFGTAAAQLWVCGGCHGAHPSGSWHIIASGRAPHAGAVLPGKPTNDFSIGVETDHTVGEAWEPAMLSSLRKGTAVIFRHLGLHADDLHFHSTICAPPGRKIDPAGLSLAHERHEVALAMRGHSHPDPGKPTRPTVSLARVQAAAQVAHWSRVQAAETLADVALIKKALKAVDCETYRAWQVSLKFTGPDADGVPGETSLTALAEKTGLFEVVS